jgi:cytoskeleton protein RodZ
MSEAVSENESESDAKVLVGETLRSAREKKSIPIAEVASRLNLDESVVQALEEDNYESLPEIAYIRGYLLAYIRLMDLPTSILKSFDEANQDDAPLIVTRNLAQSSCSQDGWVRCISTGLAVLLVIVSVLWVLEQSFHILDVAVEDVEQVDNINPSENDDDKVEPAEVFSMENELEESSNRLDEALPTEIVEVTEGQNEIVPGIEDAAQMKPEEVNAVDVGEPDIGTVEEQETPQVVQVPVLTMKINDTTWIRISDDEGNRLKNGTFSKGKDINLTHNGPLHLVIGRTNNIELTYDGKLVDLSSYDSGGVARLVLGKSVE